MAFFKKRVNVTDYCGANLATLFAKERETTWDEVLVRFSEVRFAEADKKLYHNNLRAIMTELMLIAITKTYIWKKPRVSSDARDFVMKYFDEYGLKEINSLCGEYNQAFGSSSIDGVAMMVRLFSSKFAHCNPGEQLLKQLHLEFYGMLNVFYDDLRSIRLLPAK